MNTPVVSIIMSTYNNSKYVREAIDSVLRQSFISWEFIILNDASTDNTDEIIRSYAKNDLRFKYSRNTKNEGQTSNLNKGIEFAKGEFIAIIDGDDVWTDENKLKKQINFLTDNNEYGLVGSLWVATNESGEMMSRITYPTTDARIRDYLLIEDCFLHSSVVIRKTVLNKIGHYDIKYRWAQDYDLWLRIGIVSKFHNIPEYMVSYRVNQSGISHTKYKEQLYETYEIVKNYKKMYPNSIKGSILWHLRTYFPVWFKKLISKNIVHILQSKSNLKYV